VAHKGNIAQFWTDENSAQGAFRANGCVIGQNWDTSAAALMKDGLPIGYLAPKEGALAWLQNFVIPKKGNADAAYAWLTWFNTDKASAMWADAYAANPVAKGADQYVAEFNRKFLAMAYPGDALQKLWWWPAQEGWFTSKRNEYVDKLQSA
jgi:spermidine/putrescine transport system substrate-binding protein